jgi:hypothetical protein
MSAKKELPMNIDDGYDILHILEKRHTIPYHSRPFMWTADKYINLVSHEMINSWKKDKLYWLGIVLMYTGGNLPAISDAQHRLTIVFLMILSLSNLLKSSNIEYSIELLSWISEYGRKSVLRTEIPDADNEILIKQEWTRYPNIESCYDNDFEALGNLLNGKSIDELISESKIYSAYSTIISILEENLDEDSYANFAQYLYSSVKVTRICIPDWEFTIVVFNSFNNIKVAVPSSFLLKNRFAHIMGEKYSADIHTLFQNIQTSHPKNFEQYIHLLSNLYCNRLINKVEYENSVTTLINKDISNPLETFAQINMQVTKVYDALDMDRFGNIFKNYFVSGHEVYSLCLIPIGYKMLKCGRLSDYFELVRKLIAFAIRIGKKVSFNQLKFQTFITNKSNKFLEDKLTWEELIKLLTDEFISWLDINVRSENVIKMYENEKFEDKKFSKARGTLLYLIEATDSYEARINHAKVQIDHIYPKNPSKKHIPLSEPDNKHKLGNFTPFISCSKTDEMKGNEQLGNKTFDVKVPYYKLSNIAITRDLAKYETKGFTDTEIKERTLELAKKIEQITAIDLGIKTR